MPSSLATLSVTDRTVERVDDYFAGNFRAMASPCTVLIDTDDRAEAAAVLAIAADEALRIESKFSRYRRGNLVDRINNSLGTSIEVDDETSMLLDYAATCYQISDGMFDITSGVLRRAWTFDGRSRVPGRRAVAECLRYVGWSRVQWEKPMLTLPAGMQIDFGGIGKEYAVDRAAALIAPHTRSAYLVNFGGDLYASGARRMARSWSIGIDDPARSGGAAVARVEISRGGVATSGDAQRYILWHGKRLGHILNPKTGCPIEGAPRSVTVAARTCTEAGTLSTLAYLHGPHARAFLEAQHVQFWIV